MATVRGFKIDATTGDLVFVSGQVQMVAGVEAIAQAHRAALRLIKGEWPFDTSKGVDYFGKVLVKAPDLPAIQQEIRNALLRVPGTATIESLSLEYDEDARALSVEYEATVDTGELIAQTVEV